MRPLLFVLFALAAVAVGAQPLGLSEAQDLAAQRSRQAAALAAASAAAREMAVAAGQRPDPLLSFGIANLPVEGPDRFRVGREPMTMRSIGVMQELTRADKLAARSRGLAHEAKSAEAEAELARRVAWRDAGLAWLDLHFARRAESLIGQQRAEALLQEQGAVAALRAGRGSPADALTARQAIALLEDRAAQAALEVRAARIALERWVGDAASRPLAALPGPGALHLQETAALQARVAAHPQLDALAQQQAAAEAQAAAASAARRPDWTVELMYGRRGSAFGDMVSVNLSVPLQVDRGRRQDRELAARLAQAERRAAERDEALRAALGEAQALLARAQSMQGRLARYDAVLLPLAGDRIQAALAGYRGGAVPLAGVLEARRADLDTRMEKLQLERELARSLLQLEFLTGPQ